MLQGQSVAVLQLTYRSQRGMKLVSILNGDVQNMGFHCGSMCILQPEILVYLWYTSSTEAF